MVVGAAPEHEVGTDRAGGHDDLDAVVGPLDGERAVGEPGLELGFELPADLAGAPRNAVVDVDRLAELTLVPVAEPAGKLVLNLLDVGRDDDEPTPVRLVPLGPQAGEEGDPDQHRERGGGGDDCGAGTGHGRSV